MTFENSILPIITGVIIVIIGGYFTYRYKVKIDQLIAKRELGYRSPYQSDIRILAESSRFQVQSVFEDVDAIDHLTGASFSLGYHYGDPDEAYITDDEQWILVLGDGVTARHTYGPGPLIELFRHGSAPAAQDLAKASPPDPDYPGNPFPEELYPVKVVVLSVSPHSVIRLTVQPALHTPSIWLLVLKRDGSLTLNLESSQ